MAIKVDFDSLFLCARRMGAPESNFGISLDRIASDPIDIQLSEGKEIKLEDLSSSEGLLSYKGRQVLLYIPDQGWSVDEALNDGKKGRRFHVADCKTLSEMRAKGRFERYVVTNNLSGEFDVYGTSKDTRTEREGVANLMVCRNCLEHLNYKGYRSQSRGERWSNFVDFSISKFFEDFSSFFKFLPSSLARRRGEPTGYSSDWKVISDSLRQQKGYKCEDCSVELRDRKDLVHVHHKNGVKSDNSASNLQVLCKLCHAQCPSHDHLFISHAERRVITEARRSQRIGDAKDWAEAFELADPGLHGVLHLCTGGHYDIPDIGLDLQDSSGAVIAYLDLAWPKDKVGIAIDENDRAAASKAGWVVYSPIEALDEENGPVSRR